MTTWIYIVQSLPWAAGGMLAGATLAIMAIRRGFLKGLIMTGPRPDPVVFGRPGEGPPAAMPPERPELPLWRRGTFWLGAVVALVGLGTVGQGWVLGNRTASLQRCQQAYLVGVSDNLRTVREASKAATDDLTRVIKLVRDLRSVAPADAQIQFDRALDDYLTSREKADQAARDNPIRDPRDLCQDL